MGRFGELGSGKANCGTVCCVNQNCGTVCCVNQNCGTVCCVNLHSVTVKFNIHKFYIIKSS